MTDFHERKFLFLCTDSSGGTWPPVIALMKALQEMGHTAMVVAEQSICEKSAPDKFVAVPESLHFNHFYLSWLTRVMKGEVDPVACGFLSEWAAAMRNRYLDVFREYMPDCIVTCLSCIDLACQLSRILDIPWCVVNPGCYLGERSARTIGDDFVPVVAPGIAHYYPDKFAEATLVIHATDNRFDPQPDPLPANQYCSGPLEWEIDNMQHVPEYLDDPGDPWVLISAGTYHSDRHSEFVLEIINALEERQLRMVATLDDAESMWRHEKKGKIYFERRLPHSRVMPKCRFYIGPAGHGTVLKCLRHGLPMVLIPIGFDQPGVAHRASQLGSALIVNPENYSRTQLQQNIDRLMEEAFHSQAASEMATYLQQKYPQPQHSARFAADVLLKRMDSYFSA